MHRSKLGMVMAVAGLLALAIQVGAEGDLRGAG
jgi:hypothetical protein